jgi:hypothetical protein
MVNFIMLVAFTTEGFNSDEFNSGGLHEKRAVATGDLGTVSAFAWRQRQTKRTCVEMAGRILTSSEQSGNWRT